MKVKSLNPKYTNYILIAVAAILFLFTAYRSSGYYHADEHYQILEFAGYTLGTHTPDELAWEFRAQIRPTLQPIIAATIIKGLTATGFENPYNIAFVFRILSALLALLIITLFYLRTNKFIAGNNLKNLYRFASYFLWFIPFISVRYSSETWSALFFMAAIILSFNSHQKFITPFVIGFLMGISFEFRFQTAFMILGYLCWVLFNNSNAFNRVINTTLGLLVVVALSFFVDSWFYNAWVFTPWNYFYANIIDGAAASFGTLPWYYYLIYTIKYPGVIIGIPLLLSFCVLVVKQPRNIVVWIVIPFIIAHSVTAHKELRFLFPLVYFAPFILVSGYQYIIPFVNKSSVLKAMAVIYFTLLFIFNSTGIAAMASKSAGLGFMDITRYIYTNYQTEKVTLYHSPYTNPFNPWHCLPNKFYGQHNITSVRIDEPASKTDDILQSSGTVNLLILRKSDLDNTQWGDFVSTHHFSLIKQSIPEWIEKINVLYRGFNSNEILLIYRQEPTESTH